MGWGAAEADAAGSSVGALLWWLLWSLQAGWTALKKAALNGHEMAVELLLDSGAHANIPEADSVGRM
jgi:hypothetical protein